MTGRNVCCVNGCNNNQLVIKPHVKQMRWHRIPRPSSKKNEEIRNAWVTMISKGKKGFNPGNETFVRSNHFVDGEPTQRYPYPTLALVSSSSQHRKPPVPRQVISVWPSQKNFLVEPISNSPNPPSPTYNPQSIHSALRFCFITREADVKFYTGLPGTSHFQTLTSTSRKKLYCWTTGVESNACRVMKMVMLVPPNRDRDQNGNQAPSKNFWWFWWNYAWDFQFVFGIPFWGIRFGSFRNLTYMVQISRERACLLDNLALPRTNQCHVTRLFQEALQKYTVYNRLNRSICRVVHCSPKNKLGATTNITAQ